MIIDTKYKIIKDSDLLFAKIDISNKLKKAKPEYVNFFTFAVMELGTNLLKHVNGGEIWLLNIENEYLLAALDRGEGIKNLEWSMKKGHTTYKNSLGLGLYQLSNNDFFDFKIFTSSEKPHGSILLLKPKSIQKNFVVLNENYMGLNVSGDYFSKKGRFFMLGDASGHGIKAHKASEFIVKYFLNNVISCIFIDDFFKNLHKELKSQNLRSSVVAIGEINKEKLNLCGVGNIGVIHKKNNNIEKKFFKDGIVGEAFSSASKYSYNFTKNSLFCIFSDGIDEEMMYNILKHTDDIYLVILCAIFYSDRIDDKIILAIKGE